MALRPLRAPSLWVLAACLGALAAAWAVSCSSVRITGYSAVRGLGPWDLDRDELFHIRPATPPAEGGAGEAALAALTPRELEALFYSDLGPQSVDVSAYPAEQRENYAVYGRVCSQCHSLARSLHAPAVSRPYWEFYLLSMRARSRFRKGTMISKEEAQAVIDFLVYDSRVRKVERREEFDRATEALKLRFYLVLREQMRRLQQEPQPQVLEPK